MPITEGTNVTPLDNAATKVTGWFDGTNFWLPRIDNSTSKALRVALYDALGNPLLVADDAAFTPGTGRVVPIGALADETAPDQVDEGDVGVPRMTLSRVLRVVPSTAAGADLVGQQAMAASVPVVLASNQSAVPVSNASLPLPAGAATEATLGTTNTDLGGLTEAAPATDTASSGLNGRLQRVAQRLTSLIALLPTSLGQKAMTASLPVVVASDQSAVPVSVAGLPASLGQKAMAASLAVVVASDQSALPVTDGAFAAAAATAAGTAYPTTTIVRTAQMLDNGTTLDPQQANVQGTVLVSAARTATASSSLTNRNGRVLGLFLWVTAKAGATTLTVRVSWSAMVSAQYVEFAAVAAGTGVPYTFWVGPGIVQADFNGATHLAKQVALGRNLSVTVVPSDASSVTYQVDYVLAV